MRLLLRGFERGLLLTCNAYAKQSSRCVFGHWGWYAAQHSQHGGQKPPNGQPTPAAPESKSQPVPHPEPPAEEPKAAGSQPVPEARPRFGASVSPTSLHLGHLKKCFFYSLPNLSEQRFETGRTVTVYGFLSSRRVRHSNLIFANLATGTDTVLQIISALQQSPETPEESTIHEALRAAPLHSPVIVTGQVTQLRPQESAPGQTSLLPDLKYLELKPQHIQVVNEFPKDVVVSDGARFPPAKRFLELRFSPILQNRLRFRAVVKKMFRAQLSKRGFIEFDTPILFKSTPEGAREFLVPTRRPGMAYALTQSPQQFKQVLMAGGVFRYYQFAPCFRDEDLRADRQPEFTQLDLELSFADGNFVMSSVEDVIKSLLYSLNRKWEFVRPRNSSNAANEKLLTRIEFQWRDPLNPTDQQPIATWQFRNEFPRISYDDALSRFGTDKPDLRIPHEIRRVDQVLPESFVRMITNLENPIVEAVLFRLSGDESKTVSDVRRCVQDVMASLPAVFHTNPDGAPVVLVQDPSQPLNGFSSIGHEGYQNLTRGDPGLEDFANLKDSDVILFQARSKEPSYSSSTALGRLRSIFYDAAVKAGLLAQDLKLHFVWITGFPLFKPSDQSELGQGGRAGLSSNHHPFTAPLREQDFDLLTTNPLHARADHYDLVINGVEVGGGSRRIHVAELQEFIMRDVLKMTDDGVSQFSHLLEALRSGCPPHAGFALGFDRFMAILSRVDSIRDVIPFPKSQKGEDLMMGGPCRMTPKQLETYHLALHRKGSL